VAAVEMLRALRRHWLVVVVGLLITFGAVAGVRQVPGVYETRVTLILLPPGNAVPNPLLASDPSLVATAAVLQRAVEQGTVINTMASNDVTISGLGERHGWSVRLPPSGNQWVFWFDRAVLDVQAVGSTPEEVDDQLVAAKEKIDAALARIQDGAAVPASARIRVVQGAETSISYGGGRPARSSLGVVVLGIGLTLTGVHAARRRAERREVDSDFTPATGIRVPVAPRAPVGAADGSRIDPRDGLSPAASAESPSARG